MSKWNVGDDCVVTNVNARPKHTKIEKVGRKFVTAGGHDFEAATGRDRDKTYSHFHLYTLAEWERVIAVGEVCDAVNCFKRASVEGLTNAQLRALRDILRNPALTPEL